jgi:type III secretion protein I
MQITITPAELTPSLGVDDLAPGDVPDTAAAARFSELMDAPTDAVDGVDAKSAVEAAAPVTGPRTLGDNILGGLQHVSSDLQQTWHALGDALSGSAPLHVQDLMKMQLQLSTMGVQYELVSKAVTRSTQNIDQLVKLQ